MKRAPYDLLMALGVAIATPVWAVSLPTEGLGPPLPERSLTPASMTADESWSAGSSLLVPLMAVDVQANQTATVDAPEPGAGGETGKPLDDIAFVKQATESGRKKVASAREALPQLQRPELKRIAGMLVDDHSGANARLAELADSKGWPVPGAKAAPSPPSGTASSDFDATWTTEMIAGHERSVNLYRAEAQNGEDKDLRKYARETLPTIERHLAELRRLQK